MRKFLIILVFLSFLFQVRAQRNLWTKKEVLKNELPSNFQDIVSYQTFHLDIDLLRNKLNNFQNEVSENSTFISVPIKNNQLEVFQVREASNFSKELQEKYPTIKSYRGFSVKNPEKLISISFFESYVKINLFLEKENIVIKPVNKNSGTYVKYKVGDQSIEDKFTCLTLEKGMGGLKSQNVQNIDDGFLRTYRLAVTTDGEFGSYFGGVLPSLAEINDLLTIVNSIYERDLSIHLELIANNDQLIYMDKDTDPYLYNSMIDNNLNQAAQQTIDNVIGSGNYDVGILFSGQVSGGNAGGIATVGDSNFKGSAYAGSLISKGYDYAMIVAHEIGHQFGANHTFSRTELKGTNVEPGSGTTVMGYSGSNLPAEVQSVSDDEFHTVSISQISNFIKNLTNCGALTSIVNNAPIISDMQNYYIPTGTAFKLSGAAIDADNDVLTYSWEQIDSNNSRDSDDIIDILTNYPYPSPTSTYLPSFRVYPPTTDPIQYFPPIEEVLRGSLYSTWNMISQVGRELNFAFQVRDNSPLGGQTAADQITVFVEEGIGPFQITSIQKNQTYQGGVKHSLTWEVNGTDTGSVGVSHVKILSSVDGGETFNVLVASTPNDGKEEITLPTGEVDEAFIMVEAIDNIFYTVSPVFSINRKTSIDCFTVKTSTTFPFSLPTSFDQQVDIPIEVTQTGMIEDININLEFSDVGVENLEIAIAHPSVGEKYLYRGQCDGRADMKFTFDQEGESLVNNCDALNGQRVEPPNGTLEDYYGLEMQGTWYIVINYSSLLEYLESTETGGSLLSAELEFCSRKTTPLSVDDFDKSTLKIYPNPATDYVSFTYDRSSGEPVELGFYSLAGTRVKHENYTNFNELSNQGLLTSDLSTGIYLLKFKEGNREIIKKLIIQ